MFHFALLVVYFLIMVTYVCVIFVAKVDFFNDPHALCRSIGRQAFIDSMFVSMCAIGFGLFCLLMQMIQKIENAEYARLIFRCLLFLFVIAQYIAYLGAVLASFDMRVLIDGPNDTYYFCDFDLIVPENPVNSSFEITNSTDINQTCQFWSVEQLCEIKSSSFSKSAPFLTINGTLGAYSCRPSTSMASDLCWAYIASTHSVWIAALVCLPCSLPFIVAVGFWLKDTKKFRYCEKCYDMCRCCICRQMLHFLRRIYAFASR